MNKLDLEKIIQDLSKKRSVFHSEADFQFSLSWEIKLQYPNANIRLEKPMDLKNDKHSYLDIFIELDGVNYAIELKYKTCGLDGVFDGEKFCLLNQSAHNIGKYDFIKDISRLEKFKSEKGASYCYAIIITNEKLYYKKTNQENKTASQFNIYDGHTLEQGDHNWNLRIGQEPIKGRANPIILEQSYPLHWKDYSNNGQFKYLFLSV